MKSLGIYIHTPFCAKKCAYCDFYSAPGDKKTYSSYASALCRHIEESNMTQSGYKVDTIYFGGGTPSLMPVREIEHIVKALRLNFNILSDAEMTIEANPDSIDLKKLKKLKSLGFNRISIGAQSSNDDELATLGRIHNFDGVKAAVKAARVAGFENLSLDLMYGIPNQTMESFKKSLLDILDLSPEHISFYALKLEEGTPMAQCADMYSFPEDDTVADMYLMAVDLLKERGYEQYEISNFAKGGKVSRHNVKYWNLDEYLGFGPSAHSLLNNLRFSYVKDTNSYIKGIFDSGVVVDSREEIYPSEQASEYIMLSLRTANGISPTVFEARYSIFFDEIEKALCKFSDMGLAEHFGTNWRLTPRGFLVSNSIISELLIALENSKTIKERK
ncbi:MAG: radical SAM family heme chaperone HemW [Clostridia bacterium]|nr:radical SAM family heme chaperone HemW [Clostridia bacterium]